MKRAAVLSLFLLSASAQAGDPNTARATEMYLKVVKPIFQRKCFDCHGVATVFPWYHQIPGVRQLLDHDIREARENMDMSKDFPFQGKASPSDYLDSVEEVLHDGSMPPFRYRLIHRDSALTEEEKKAISGWINESRE